MKYGKNNNLVVYKIWVWVSFVIIWGKEKEASTFDLIMGL